MPSTYLSLLSSLLGSVAWGSAWPARPTAEPGPGVRAQDVTGATGDAGHGSLTGFVPLLRVIVAPCRSATAPCGPPRPARSTTSDGSSSTLGRSDGSAIRSSSRSQPRSPILRIAWCTVVSGGAGRLAGEVWSEFFIAPGLGFLCFCGLWGG